MHVDRRAQALLFAIAFTFAGGCTFITRASVDSTGGDSDAGSTRPSLSADGRYVTFTSFAADLVAGDGNEVFDVFRRDLRTATTIRVSLDAAGGDPDGSSVGSSISADGRYVAFDSFASDLVPGDGNNASDIFRRDLQTGTTTRLSVDTGGGDPNGYSFLGGMSGDGRFVVFQSDASDLVPGDGTGGLNVSDVFVRDVLLGTTTRVSVDIGGGDPNEASGAPAISADGKIVAFFSRASDLIVGDGNGVEDIYVHNLQTHATTRASVDIAGGDSNDLSIFQALSNDGRYVAFTSDATDLVAGDGATDGPARDVFVRDLLNGTTTRISVDPAGEDADDSSFSPAISGDGRFVAFESGATDLIAGDTNFGIDVFVRDRQTGTTTRATEDAFGRQVPGESDQGSGTALSLDGRYIAFDTSSQGLVAGDDNGEDDVFVRAVVEPSVGS